MAKILISVSKDTQIEVYEAAVKAAGGEPTAQYLPQWDSQYDGLLLGGGVDMDPKYFGEPIDGTEEIDGDRDVAELKLLEACLAEGKPVLGICRGHQVMNVYFGGSLHQNLANAVDHRGKVHPVVAEAGSRIAGLMGENFVSNSTHHQGVKVPGKGMRITARAGDVVEAIEHESLPVMGAQFHPERMTQEYKNPDASEGLPIFQWFINACKK